MNLERMAFETRLRTQPPNLYPKLNREMIQRIKLADTYHPVESGNPFLVDVDV